MRARTSSAVVTLAALATLALASAPAFAEGTAGALPLPHASPAVTGFAQPAPATCNRVLPLAGRATPFRHFRNRFTLGTEGAQHRAYDAFVRDGEAEVVTAQFAYDSRDARLEDEDVDVYALRDCARWELLGSTRTSRRGQATLDVAGGESREGGRVAFSIPAARRLGPGLHRVRFVVRGDRSTADAYLDVVPATGARFVVTDVDGTLTDSEAANLRAMMGIAHVPGAHPGAAAALRSLATRGYQVFYLTGRPDMYQQDTRAWLETHGFPPGVLRTRQGTSAYGIGGPDTTAYKTRELAFATRQLGHTADWAFGNTGIDVAAYASNGVAPTRRFFYRFDGERRGGQRLDDYRSLGSVIGSEARSQLD